MYTSPRSLAGTHEVPKSLAFRIAMPVENPRLRQLAEACGEVLITATLSRTQIARARFELPTLRDADTPLIRELMAGYR